MTFPGGLLSSLLTQGVNAAGAVQSAKLDANKMALQQALQSMMLGHQFAKDAATMGYERSRGDYYNRLANQPTPQQHVVDPTTGKVTFFDPMHPPEDLSVTPQPKAQGHVVDPTTGKVTFFDPTHPPTNLTVHPKPDNSIVLVQDPGNPTGPGVFVRKSDALGRQGATAKGASGGPQAAAVMSKAGQFGELLKKTPDLIPAMESLDVKLGQSAAGDVAQHGVGIGPVRLPGTKGIGNMLLNNTPEYARYQAALAPWVLSAAHATSGARINQEQANMIQRSVEMNVSDPSIVRQQRIKNVIDQLNSIAASLPAAEVAAQEAQMDPQMLDFLRTYGYRGASGRSGAAPAPRTTPTAAPTAPPTASPASGNPRGAKRDHGIFGSND